MAASAFLVTLFTYIHPLVLPPVPPFHPTLHPELSLLTRTTFNFTQSIQPGRPFPTGTPNAHIEFVFLTKRTSDAFIDSLTTKAASCPCLLNPASLRNYIPRTHPCRLVTAKAVENDATTHSSSPFVSLRVDHPAREAWRNSLVDCVYHGDR